MAATVDMKLLRATKFPPEFNQKVDMHKVNLQVMKKWIASKLADILGAEDDVVTELCFNLIEGSRFPDIKSMQIQLTGFLEKETAPFCKDMWHLFLSAQSSPQGVPQELLEAKKLELIQEKLEAEKSAEEARLRRENQERRNREITDIRDRERRDRGFRGGRGDNWRGETDLGRVHPLDEALIVVATVIATYHKVAVAATAAALQHAQPLPVHVALRTARALDLVPVATAAVVEAVSASLQRQPQAFKVQAPRQPEISQCAPQEYLIAIQCLGVRRRQAFAVTQKTEILGIRQPLTIACTPKQTSQPVQVVSLALTQPWPEASVGQGAHQSQPFQGPLRSVKTANNPESK
ncbi:hypothetical protein AB5N19_05291 [Seiridium cardinale]